jgi:hypothetical protein
MTLADDVFDVGVVVVDDDAGRDGDGDRDDMGDARNRLGVVVAERRGGGEEEGGVGGVGSHGLLEDSLK